MDQKELKDYLQQNPTAFAGLRALKISNQGREETTAESNEVPFIFSLIFLPSILAYTILIKAKYTASSVAGLVETKPERDPDHIFVMTSEHKYRTYAFEQVGKQLLANDKEVMFICSPSASEKIETWNEAGFRTESFQKLLRFVSIPELIIRTALSLIIMYKTKTFVEGYLDDFSYAYVFNSIVLEHIKEMSIGELTSDISGIHTYSLMPYQVKSTESENLYVYQHGVQLPPEEDTWSGTWAFPSNILIWGEAWIDNYKELVHSDSNIHIVGSPWHDYLAESRKKETNTANWDVVMICNSMVAEHSEKRANDYENLISNLIEYCEKKNLSLAFKLHPVEDREWYIEHGWENYIVDFKGIEDALKSSNIAVSQSSSAFVESIVLGTPIILDEEWNSGLESLRPIFGVSFVEVNNLESEIEDLARSDHKPEKLIKNSQLVNVGDSAQRIVNLVM